MRTSCFSSIDFQPRCLNLELWPSGPESTEAFEAASKSHPEAAPDLYPSIYVFSSLALCFWGHQHHNAKDVIQIIWGTAKIWIKKIKSIRPFVIIHRMPADRLMWHFFNSKFNLCEYSARRAIRTERSKPCCCFRKHQSYFKKLLWETFRRARPDITWYRNLMQ